MELHSRLAQLHLVVAIQVADEVRLSLMLESSVSVETIEGMWLFGGHAVMWNLFPYQVLG